MLYQSYATGLGLVSLLLWSITAVMAASLVNIPAFQVLMTISGVGFLTCTLVNTYFKLWPRVMQHPPVLYLLGLIGIFGNDCLYILSFRYAPAIHVDLIAYLWPILFILFSHLIWGKGNISQYMLPVVIAFLGIAWMLMADAKLSWEIDYSIGYSMAFIGAVLWSIYLIVSRLYGQSMHEIFVVYTLCGTFIAGFIHFRSEVYVIPTAMQWLQMSVMGVFSHCLSYIFWDHGMKYGSAELLAVLSYISPIISAVLLIAFGLAKLTMSLFIAMVMLSVAIFMVQDAQNQIVYE